NELAKLINYFEKNNNCYIVVGDFNSDPNRNKPFDQELKALIKKERLTCFEEKWNNYSYSYSNGVHYSLIDHVISTSKVVDIIESVEIVKPNVLNISDHLPIKTKIKLEIEIVNQKIQINYASLLENEILSQKLIEKLEDSDPINIKSVIDEIINSLHSSMISCSKKVNNNKILRKIKRKSKDWWDEKLEKLHTEMKQQLWIYKQSSYTDSQSKIKYKRLKQDFRNTQRKNLNDVNKKFTKLLNSYKTLNLKAWRLSKRKRRVATECQLNVENLLEVFKEMFNKKIVTRNEENERDNEALRIENDKFEGEVNNNDKTNFNKININIEFVHKVIKNLPNGKARGFNDVSNELYKYGSTRSLIELTAILMEKIINMGLIPTLFKCRQNSSDN
ncbi:hypothetical protein BpHYR1_030334, partial [Brachionus plicatilis]